MSEHYTILETKRAILNLVYKSVMDGVVTTKEVQQIINEAEYKTGASPYSAGPTGVPPSMSSMYNMMGPGGPGMGSSYDNYDGSRKRRKLNEPTGPRYKGNLTKYNPSSGYGFIKTQDAQLTTKYPNVDIFVHRFQYEELCANFPMFTMGAPVEFSIEEKDGKPQARAIVCTI